MAAASPLKRALGQAVRTTSGRTFATTSRLDAGYGFIGLGQMGKISS